MPNNFIFDSCSSDLTAIVYGMYDSTTPVALAVDAEGNLDIGVAYTSAAETVVLGTTESGGAMTLDSSEKSLYSYYVRNLGDETTVTVKLQVSPTETASYYVDDSSTTYTLEPDGGTAILIPKYYLHYTRLYIDNPDASSTATVQVFYDARQ